MRNESFRKWLHTITDDSNSKSDSHFSETETDLELLGKQDRESRFQSQESGRSIKPNARPPSETLTLQLDVFDGNSPYAEVRASVPNIDDDTMPENTIRMWVIGLILMSAATIMNAIFFIHDPPFVVSPYLIIVLAWPIGWIWERVVPNIWGLNPGKFTYKEHVLISMLAAASSMSLTSDTVISLTNFYQANPLGSNIGFVLLINWSTALAGMSLIGPFKKILVEPPSMIWPTQLVTVTLLSNIHVKWNHVANGWRITRKRFFCYAAVVCCIYSFLVHFFARFLSHFSFASWISPDNYVVNQLFGTISGAGMFPIFFDWNTVSGFLPSPLVPPARVFINTGISLIVFVWVIATGIHYSNIWWGHYLPFSDSKVFDRFGHEYNMQEVSKDLLKLDETKYHQYSPVFIATTRLMNFGMGLAASMSILVQTALFDSGRIMSYFRKSPSDVHSVLMRRYNPIPMYWYGLLFCLAGALVYTSIYAFPANIYGWYPIVALGIVAVWIVPIAFVCAATTVTVNVGSLAMLITGYMDPGNAMAMMLFKNWTVSAVESGVQYTSMLKLGHYTKIRPKVVFWVCLVSILWSGTLQTIILIKVKPYIAHECKLNQDSGFTCAKAYAFFTESVVWGVVGSKRMMELYSPILHLFWVGALAPVLVWIYLKKWPRSRLRILHWPLIFDTLENVPPASPYNVTCWVLTGFAFSHWIRRYWHSWWAKYCYTLSAALDFGLAAMELIIFFIYVGTQYTGPTWWGNNGYRHNIDGHFLPMTRLKPGETFGPKKW